MTDCKAREPVENTLKQQSDCGGRCVPLSPFLSPLRLREEIARGGGKLFAHFPLLPLAAEAEPLFVAQLPTTPFTAGKHATKDLPRSQVSGCWEGVARNNNCSNILTGQTVLLSAAVVNKYLLLSGLTPGLAAPLCSSRGGGGGCRRRRRLLRTFPESPRPLPPSQCSSPLAPGCTSSTPPFPTICRSPNDLTPSTTSPCPRRHRRRSLLLPRAILHPVLPGAVRSARDRLPGVQAAGKKKKRKKMGRCVIGGALPIFTILCHHYSLSEHLFLILLPLLYCCFYLYRVLSFLGSAFAKDIFVCVL